MLLQLLGRDVERRASVDVTSARLPSTSGSIAVTRRSRTTLSERADELDDVARRRRDGRGVGRPSESPQRRSRAEPTCATAERRRSRRRRSRSPMKRRRVAEADDAATKPKSKPPSRRRAGRPTPPRTTIDMDWYILKVQSNREESIADALKRKIAVEGLDKYFDEIIVPTEKVTEFKGGKKKVVERKLYPGYIVVHMADQRRHLVRWSARRRASATSPAPAASRRRCCRTKSRGSCRPKKEETTESAEAGHQVQDGRPREGQGRHVRELRRRSRHDRRGQRPRHGDDQHLRPQHAGRIGILANRSDVVGSVSCDGRLSATSSTAASDN